MTFLSGPHKSLRTAGWFFVVDLLKLNYLFMVPELACGYCSSSLYTYSWPSEPSKCPLPGICMVCGV